MAMVISAFLRSMRRERGINPPEILASTLGTFDISLVVLLQGQNDEGCFPAILTGIVIHRHISLHACPLRLAWLLKARG